MTHHILDLSILHRLADRTHASAAEIIGTACAMAFGEVRARLADLESLRHVMSRTDARLVLPERVFLITSEGRRSVISGAGRVSA